MIDWLVILCAAAGIFFIAMSCLALIKLKDFFLRLQAASKASTLGVILCAGAVALYFQNSHETTRAFLITFFVFLTSPITAQVLASAGYDKEVLKAKLILDEKKEDADKSRD